MIRAGPAQFNPLCLVIDRFIPPVWRWLLEIKLDTAETSIEL